MKSATTDSRVSQEPLAVLWEEVHQLLVHQVMTTPALIAPAVQLAAAATATPAVPASIAPAVQLAAVVTATPAAADMTTPPPAERNQASCENKSKNNIDSQD